MYNIKYQLEYSSLGGYNTTINIKKKNYTGEIIELKGSEEPFNLVYEPSENYQFTTFINSYSILNVFELDELKNDFIEIIDEDDYILEYRRNNILFWSGYIMPEEYNEGDDVNQPWISLKFFDGISRLKLYNLNDLNLSDKKYYTLEEIFSAINNKLYSNINPNTNFLFNDYLLNTTNVSLKLPSLIAFKKDSFFDQDGIAINLYDYILSIAKSFNFCYFIYKDRLVISNFEYSDNPRFYNYETNNIILNNKRVNIDDNHLFINISKEINFLDALKRIEFTHKYDGDLNFIDIRDLDNVERLDNFSSATAPVINENSIVFNSFSTELAAYPNKDYRKVSISNSVRYNINNPISYFPGFYNLYFSYKFDFEYNVTDEDIQFLSTNDANTARNRRKELQDKTTFSCFFNINNNDQFYINGGGNFLNLSTITAGQSEWWIDASYINLGKEFSAYESGGVFSARVSFLAGNNDLKFTWYQPNLHIDTLSSGNNHIYTNVKLTISDLRLVRADREELTESKFIGETDRNIFNLNLFRNRDFNFINVPENNYKYNVIRNNGGTLNTKSFRRRTKDYNLERNENLDVQDLIINQSLEQFETQQKYITGDLLVRNDINFDILSSINIDNKIYSIHKYSLNDYNSIYDIELLEIK